MPEEVATLAVGLVLNTGAFFGVLGGTLNSAASKLTSWGMTASALVTAPLVAGAKAVGDAAIGWEAAFAGVRKTVEGVVDAEGNLTALGEEMQKAFRELSKEIPVTHDELARIGELAGALGVPTDRIIDFVEQVAMLAATTDLTIDAAAEDIARFQTITGKADEPIDRIANTLVDLGNKLAATESEIVAFSLRIAGAGNIVGMTQSEIMAFGGALASIGLNAEAGGTAISRVMIDISSIIDSTTDEDVAKVERLGEIAGVTGDEFRKAFKENAARAILSFVQGLQEARDSGQNLFLILDELGFSEIRVRDTMLRLAGAGDLLAKSLDISEAAWENNNAMVIEASRRFETQESKIIMLKNRWKDFLITLGTVYLPILGKIVDKIGVVIDRVNEWVQENEDLARTFLIVGGGLAAVLAAVGPVLLLAKYFVMIGSLASGLGKVIIGLASAFTGTGGAASGLGGVLGGIWNFLFAGAASVGELASAFGVLGAIIAALIATVRFLWVYGKQTFIDLFEGGKKFVEEFLKSIDTSRWGPVIDGLAKLWDVLVVVLKIVGGVLGTVVLAAFQAIGAALPFLGALLGDFINLLGSLASLIMTVVIGPLDILWTLFAEGPEAAWEKVKFYMEQGRASVLGILGSLFSMGVDLIGAFGAAFVGLISGAASGVLGIIEDLFGKSTEIFGMKLEEIRVGVQQFKTDIVGMFMNLRDEVVGWITGLVDDAIGLFNSLQEALIGGSIIPEMIGQIEGAFGQMGKNVAQSGVDMMKGITGGVPAIAGAAAGVGAGGAVALAGAVTSVQMTNYHYWDASISAKDRSEIVAAAEKANMISLAKIYGEGGIA